MDELGLQQVSSADFRRRYRGAYCMQLDLLVLESYGMPRCIPDLESKDDRYFERLSSSGMRLEEQWQPSLAGDTVIKGDKK